VIFPYVIGRGCSVRLSGLLLPFVVRFSKLSVRFEMKMLLDQLSKVVLLPCPIPFIIIGRRLDQNQIFICVVRVRIKVLLKLKCDQILRIRAVALTLILASQFQI